MKFKKRFLMYLAIVGVILAPSMAKADDANSNHGWMRGVPNDNLDNVVTVGSRTTNRVKRNQTVYWAIWHDSNPKVIDTSTTTPSLTTCTVPGTCVSAPLFIASTTAILCADSELAGVTDGDTVAKMRICSDSTCTDETSVEGQAADPGPNGACYEWSTSDAYDGFNVGGMWVYLDVTTAPAAGATTLFWVTGN